MSQATLERTDRRTELMRPLKVLVPLIKDELEAGDQAGIEHYRRAGEMLLEAKDQVARGEWTGWIERNFHRSVRQAQDYMKLASISVPKRGAPRFSSLTEAVRPNYNHEPSRVWEAPVREIASRVNVEALAKDRQDREKEARLMRQLSHQLIDIGYKVLIAKLHPDKGGSTEAMARLNKVRNILKEAI